MRKMAEKEYPITCVVPTVTTVLGLRRPSAATQDPIPEIVADFARLAMLLRRRGVRALRQRLDDGLVGLDLHCVLNLNLQDQMASTRGLCERRGRC